MRGSPYIIYFISRNFTLLTLKPDHEEYKHRSSCRRCRLSRRIIVCHLKGSQRHFTESLRVDLVDIHGLILISHQPVFHSVTCKNHTFMPIVLSRSQPSYQILFNSEGKCLRRCA